MKELQPELDREGWFVCYSDDLTRRTWHYFGAKRLRSICGSGDSYQRTISVLDYVPTMSSYALMKAAPCGRCVRQRRPIEDAGTTP